jgi:acyl carrier protein/polyketide biosynthesis acyl carrier protein
MTRDEVRNTVIGHLKELVPGTATKEIDDQMPLADLGADSLDLVDVASRSMQDLGVKLPRSAIGKIHSLSDLIDALYQECLAAEAAGATA